METPKELLKRWTTEFNHNTDLSYQIMEIEDMIEKILDYLVSQQEK